MSGWVDTHCHLDAAEFDADRDAVIERARAAGVSRLVLPAVERANFDRVRELAHDCQGAYALGIHPLYVERAAESDLQHLQEQLRMHRDDPRLVAVGEIGLDHFVPGLDLARQQHFYQAQLALAREAASVRADSLRPQVIPAEYLLAHREMSPTTPIQGLGPIQRVSVTGDAALAR